MVHKVKTFHLNRKNTILLLISLLLTSFILRLNSFYSFVAFIGKFGYVSAFVLGFIFSFGFATAPTTAALFLLAEHINPLLMALIASTGAMISNFLIFKFVKHHFMNELRYIITEDLRLEVSKLEITITRKMMKSKYFRHIFLALTGILVALPIPTEMFVSILWNLAKYDPKTVFLFSYIFNFIGILNIGLIRLIIK